MLDISQIDSSRYEESRNGAFNIEKEIPLNTPIYRYTSFSNLLSLLGEDGSSGTFYVSQRTRFSDRREQGEYCDKRLKYSHFSIAGEPINKRTLYKWSYNDAQIMDTCKLYASCWTLRAREDYLMWNAYADSALSVRIESTIQKFVESIDIQKSSYMIYGGKMYYGKEKPVQNVLDALFYKTEFYENEEEFRFYVLTSSQKEYDTAFVRLNVKPKVLIEKIILSPFIDDKVNKILIKLLSQKYDFLKDKIVTSKIMEYKKGE